MSAPSIEGDGEFFEEKSEALEKSEMIAKHLFSWPKGCVTPEWTMSPDCAEKPTSVWFLEMTEGNKASGRILLERYSMIFGTESKSSVEEEFPVIMGGTDNDQLEPYHVAVLLNPHSDISPSNPASKLTKDKDRKLEFYIMDLMTTAGTNVNGKAITPGVATQFKVGDKFTMGGSRRTFRLMRCQTTGKGIFKPTSLVANNSVAFSNMDNSPRIGSLPQLDYSNVDFNYLDDHLLLASGDILLDINNGHFQDISIDNLYQKPDESQQASQGSRSIDVENEYEWDDIGIMSTLSAFSTGDRDSGLRSFNLADDHQIPYSTMNNSIEDGEEIVDVDLKAIKSNTIDANLSTSSSSTKNKHEMRGRSPIRSNTRDSREGRDVNRNPTRSRSYRSSRDKKRSPSPHGKKHSRSKSRSRSHSHSRSRSRSRSHSSSRSRSGRNRSRSRSNSRSKRRNRHHKKSRGRSSSSRSDSRDKGRSKDKKDKKDKKKEPSRRGKADRRRSRSDSRDHRGRSYRKGKDRRTSRSRSSSRRRSESRSRSKYSRRGNSSTKRNDLKDSSSSSAGVSSCGNNREKESKREKGEHMDSSKYKDKDSSRGRDDSDVEKVKDVDQRREQKKKNDRGTRDSESDEYGKDRESSSSESKHESRRQLDRRKKRNRRSHSHERRVQVTKNLGNSIEVERIRLQHEEEAKARTEAWNRRNKEKEAELLTKDGEGR